MYAQTTTLAVVLQGEGVVPAVTCSHPGGTLDFGYVLEKQSASQVLKVRPLLRLQPSHPADSLDY